MSRSRSSLSHLVAPLAVALAGLVFAAPALAAPATEPAAWSPRLAYVLSTGSVRTVLADKLHLTKAQDAELRRIGQDLYEAQRSIQRLSDLVVMSESYTLEEKQAILESSHYNGTLASAEDSAAARAAEVTGLTQEALATAVDAIWQQDAATHRLETALTALGLTPQALTGSFRVYATRFTDEYGTTYGVALPDRYVKFANQGNTREGYPAGTYSVALYWDGVHRGRDKTESDTVTRPHGVASAKVVDVGPWNTDDNYWNPYSGERPRRINSTGISYRGTSIGGGGPDFLAGKDHLALGLPEAQAAYFSYYGRPSTIPEHRPRNADDKILVDGKWVLVYENYWDKPRGYSGQWSGADQFGRQVVSPAAVDLTPPVAHDMGMSRDTNGDGKDDYYDNEWIDMVPLWEARLDLVGSLRVTPGPYITGQRISFTYTVKNVGSLSGTWDALTFTLKTPKGVYKNPPFQGPLTLPPGGTKTLTFTQTLTDTGTLTGFPQGRRAGAWAHIGTPTVTLSNVLLRTVDRAGGPTRYETAVEISKDAYPSGAGVVVIATGLNFPDALAGAAFAHVEDGPLLLVGSTVPASVDAEVKRLKPTRIVILGSGSAVPKAVVDRLQADVPGVLVVRLGGHNRYATARLIAEEVVKHTGGTVPNGTAIIATGRTFPDALSASVLSADKRWPILLTEPGFVPTDTAAALTAISATNTLVIGGEKAVSAKVFAAMPKPTRVAGPTRYDTAAAVADLAEVNMLTYGYVGLTVGTSFPDALAGSVLAARGWGMMLLTPREGLALPVRYRLQRHRTVTTHLQAYGSVQALPEATFRQAVEALR